MLAKKLKLRNIANWQKKQNVYESNRAIYSLIICSNARNVLVINKQLNLIMRPSRLCRCSYYSQQNYEIDSLRTTVVSYTSSTPTRPIACSSALSSIPVPAHIAIYCRWRCYVCCNWCDDNEQLVQTSQQIIICKWWQFEFHPDSFPFCFFRQERSDWFANGSTRIRLIWP